jgi:hypothetical protein
VSTGGLFDLAAKSQFEPSTELGKAIEDLLKCIDATPSPSFCLKKLKGFLLNIQTHVKIRPQRSEEERVSLKKFTLIFDKSPKYFIKYRSATVSSMSARRSLFNWVDILENSL